MKLLLAFAVPAGLLMCQQGAVVANLSTAKWEKDDSVTLREDPQTGAIELFVHKPGGYTFAPHWHTANERILLLEGRMSVRHGVSAEEFLDPGGYAFLPAKEVQHLACVSKTRCTFYIHWDGKLDFHAAPK